MKICVCPGSFDPITNGHLDIIERASRLFDKVVVAVLNNSSKKPEFTLEERMDFLRCVFAGRPEIEVDNFSGLLVEFVRQKQATAIVRGLRAVTDFEYELQIAHLNKTLAPEIETLFMMTNINYSYLSSSIIRELARNKGGIDGLVPECIKDKVMKKFAT